ncbi:hypothetical protein PIB30_079216 [Stylosanthes scabra]|uniref:Uncharacterized protein n=1 Tax=Stylosanthes scabra TaxID=79078 RepID=A0ABU6UUT7_9FABA|nr:hypothetical protein [Stylosanthes scabra]
MELNPLSHSEEEQKPMAEASFIINESEIVSNHDVEDGAIAEGTTEVADRVQEKGGVGAKAIAKATTFAFNHGGHEKPCYNEDSGSCQATLGSAQAIACNRDTRRGRSIAR